MSSAIDRIKGQFLVRRILQGILKTGRLATAYLFAGPEHTGKKFAGFQFGKAINCERGGCEECQTCIQIEKGIHPDVRLITLEPDKKEISIELMRDVQKEAFLKPCLARFKVYIIEEAHTLSEEASNSLLKILEEPPEHTIFILTTSSPQGIFPTVASRCQKVRFVGTTTEDSEDLAKRENEILQFMGPEGIESFRNLRDMAGSRNDSIKIIDAFLIWYRDVLLLKEGAADGIFLKQMRENLQECANKYCAEFLIQMLKRILDARYQLANYVNPVLVMESLLVDLNHLKAQGI